MSRTGENIYKRKDGRWEGRYIINHIDGKIKYGYVYSSSYREAKKKLHNAIIGGEKPIKEYIPSDNFTAYADEWLNSLKPQLKDSSLMRYENNLRLYIFPYFKDVPVCSITNEDISNFANEMLSHGGCKGNGLSSKTVSGIISIMKNIFKFISSKGVSVNADTSSVTIKQNQKSMRVFSIYEQKKLNGYLCKNPTLGNLGILLCLYTGLRVGELCALKWGDFSFESKTLIVNKTMQRLKSKDGATKTKVVVTTPKSDCSTRTIPVPDCIINMLTQVKCADDTYFLTGKEFKYVEPRTVQNRFKAVLKKCDIADANFHALRHTFATRCIELGFDVKSLSEILGHASVNITLSRYVHPSMELKRKNMDRLSELLAVK